ncbi:MAG: hypothetical protein ACTSUK_09610 [Promethearchaeota archaeon]
MVEPEEDTSSWKSLKKMIKKSVTEVKKKIKEYSQEGEPGFKKISPLYGQKRKIISEPAPPKEYNCPFCHSPLSDELINILKEHKSIICERCGSNLQLSDF